MLFTRIRAVKSLRTRLLLLVFALQFAYLFPAAATVEAVIGSADLKTNVNLAGSVPLSSNNEILISRDQYVISYNKERRAPNWVAWKVEDSDLGHVGRSNGFKVDPDLDDYLNSHPGSPKAVVQTEYKGSCFDRGHQAPSGDRTDTAENNEATFVMSNMIPQTAYLNRVIWEHLENYTRSLVLKQGKKVYVIAGPIYDQDFGSIGPNQDIPVPSKDFKVIVVLDANQSIANITSDTPMISVIMPNVVEDGSAPTDRSKLCHFVSPAIESADDWKQYQVPVSQIEQSAGIRLFPSLR